MSQETISTFQHELGTWATDVISGFSGYITGRVQYLTGCRQYLVTPPVRDNGEPIEARWYDEDRLKVASDKKIQLPNDNDGPDLPAPIR